MDVAAHQRALTHNRELSLDERLEQHMRARQSILPRSFPTMTK